jgi:hypothetical protein
MNELLKILSGGNLQSDGKANDVAQKVLKNPELITELSEGLDEPDDLIRGRTAHAIERISRTNPKLIYPLLSKIKKLGLTDKVPMVKWHIAMIFGNLTYNEESASTIVSILLKMLRDDSVFVQSWALVSLSILGRKYEQNRKKILKAVHLHATDKSISVRTKIAKVEKILRDDKEPIPLGWIKAKV